MNRRRFRVLLFLLLLFDKSFGGFGSRRDFSVTKCQVFIKWSNASRGDVRRLLKFSGGSSDDYATCRSCSTVLDRSIPTAEPCFRRPRSRAPRSGRARRCGRRHGCRHSGPRITRHSNPLRNRSATWRLQRKPGLRLSTKPRCWLRQRTELIFLPSDLRMLP